MRRLLSAIRGVAIGTPWRGHGDWRDDCLGDLDARRLASDTDPCFGCGAGLAGDRGSRMGSLVPGDERMPAP